MSSRRFRGIAGSKDTAALLTELDRNPRVGISMGGGGHWKIAVDGRLVTVVAATASDHRGVLNARAIIRRALKEQAA
jgi:oligoribonuclease NrnB/cAMP/cGMP phosphodiesterase (DHH superfamily)